MEQVTLSAERIVAVFTRKLPGGGQQPLVCTEQGIQPLLGLEAVSLLDGGSPSVRLGPPLPLTERTPDGRAAPYTWPAAGDGAAHAPLYAVADGAAVADGSLCFLATRDTILRLDASDCVELVAGQPGCPGRRDGPGGTAQVQSALVMTTDGTGGLFFSDGARDCIRRARLAAAPRPSAAGTPPTSPPSLAVSVATLPFQIPEWSLVHALSYDFSAGVLYVCTPRVIYRAVGVGAAAGTAPPGLHPVAGGDADDGGCVDGAGRAALFGSICDAVVDARGCLYVTDMEGPGGAVVRRVDPTAGWAVQTLPSSLGDLDRAARLAILPGGWLCVYEWGGNRMWLAQLGLESSRPPLQAPQAVPAAAAAPPPPPQAVDACLAGLAEDLAAMLADPWHTADVTVAVGGSSFPAHSQMLIARCEYFRRRLLLQGGRQTAAAHPPPGATAAAAAATGDAGGGGGDGGVPAGAGRREVSLPDADPAAFAQLLRYMYTGSTDFPEVMLRPVLELANRLQLPRVGARVQQQLQLRQQHQQHQQHQQQQQQQQPVMQASAPQAPGAPPASSGATAAASGAHGASGAAAPPAPAVASWSAGVSPGAAGAAGPAPPLASRPQAPIAPPAPPSAPPPSGAPPPYAWAPAAPPPQAAPTDDGAPSAPPSEPGPLQPPLQPLQPPLQPLQPPLQSQQPQQQPLQQPQQPLQPHSQVPQQQPALQPASSQQYSSYLYPQHIGYGGPAAPPPAFGSAYGAQSPSYAAPSTQMYGVAPPPPSSSYGAPPLAPGYGAAQPPAFGAAPAPQPYCASGASYPNPPGMYGAPPPASYGAPPPYPQQGYPAPMYGGAAPPPLPPGGAYYPPPR